MIIDGEVIIANEILQTRDAIGISETVNLTIKATKPSEVLIIEVPMQVKST